MGWLELLPLLRRVLPLLDRLAPMLESVVAGRLGGRAAIEANATSLAEVSKTHNEVQSTLEDQRLAISRLSAQLEVLQSSADEARAQSATFNRTFAALTKAVRWALAAILLLVVLCVVLLTMLLLRHK